MAAVELARGNAGEASAHGLQAVDFALEAADIADDFWMAWPVAVEAALAAGDQLRAAELLKHLSLRPRGELGPYLKGELARFTAQIDDREGREMPAVYEVLDHVPNLVAYQVEQGMYVIAKVIEHGYLAIGKRRLAFDSAGR